MTATPNIDTCPACGERNIGAASAAMVYQPVRFGLQDGEVVPVDYDAWESDDVEFIADEKYYCRACGEDLALDAVRGLIVPYPSNALVAERS